MSELQILYQPYFFQNESEKEENLNTKDLYKDIFVMSVKNLI
jgi:hypothetical protein